MIRLENVSFAYGDQPVFSNLDLEVKEGEILGILGPNGCGKSTLLAVLRGALSPACGKVFLKGKRLTTFGKKEIARHIAVVSQTGRFFFAYTVNEVVAMGRFPHQGLFPEKADKTKQAVEKALEMTGTRHLADRLATRLSGGEQQRVLLARALAQDSKVLLLDEPTSHLDILHRQEMAKLLLLLRRELNKTIVHVTHDLDMGADISDRILLLPRGGERYRLGETAQVFTQGNLREVFGVDVQVIPRPGNGGPRVVFPSVRQEGEIVVRGKERGSCNGNRA